MLHSLIAWDAEGNVVATQDHRVVKDDDGNVIGLADFEAYENAGGRFRDIFEKASAVGSGTWPEWLQGAAYDFKVELDPNPGQARAKITALIHKTSGHRRDRGVIEAEIASRIAKAKERDEPADLRDLLGGPNRPLKLDAEGKTRPPAAKSQRPALPVVRREKG